MSRIKWVKLEAVIRTTGVFPLGLMVDVRLEDQVLQKYSQECNSIVPQAF